MSDFKRLFEPATIAVVGASRARDKPGRVVFDEIKRHGFKGRVVPVNSNGGWISGVTAARTVGEISGLVDVAVVVVPFEPSKRVIQDCVDSRVKFCVVVTAGFSESQDEEGALRERELLAMVEGSSTRVIGPNSNGLINTSNDLFISTTRFGRCERGGISVVAQGGAFTGCLMSAAADFDRSLGVAKSVSLGNACDVQEAEVVEYFGKDPPTKAIGLYLEHAPGAALAAGRSSATPLLVMRAGHTRTGARTAASHTGGANRRGGAGRMKARGRGGPVLSEEGLSNPLSFLDALRMMERYGDSLRRVSDLAFASMSGTYATLASDMIEATGLRLAELHPSSPDARGQTVTAANPYDLWPPMSRGRTREWQEALRGFLASDAVDALLVVLFDMVPSSYFSIEDLARLLKEGGGGGAEKPVLVSIVGERKGKRWARHLEEVGVLAFVGVDSPMRVVSALGACRSSDEPH